MKPEGGDVGTGMALRSVRVPGNGSVGSGVLGPETSQISKVEPSSTRVLMKIAEIWKSRGTNVRNRRIVDHDRLDGGGTKVSRRLLAWPDW